MTMNGSILCSAVCIRDILTKAGMCGKSIISAKVTIFCSLLLKIETARLHPEELKFEAKSTSFV